MGVTESVAKLSPAIMGKAEQVCDEVGRLAKIPKCNVDGATWSFLLHVVKCKGRVKN